MTIARSALLASLLPFVLFGAALPRPATAIPLKSLKQPKKTANELRTDYLNRLMINGSSTPERRTVGSLWSPDAALADVSSDYKARQLHDLVVVQVSVLTNAAQSSAVDSSRNFSTNSAITGLLGALTSSTSATNPLFAASSANALKGSGQTTSNTTFTTDLAGEVIAVLPNGNLVVEAHRQISMNNQHEEVIVRGVARPGDISPNNIVPSAALSSLEIEMKGKGIISDSTRPPNPLTRAVLWLFGF